MKRLVEFSLENGDSIMIEVDEQISGTDVRRSANKPGEIAMKANQTFESALDHIKPAAEIILSRLTNLSSHPSEIVVEFGLKVNAQAGMFVANCSAEANYSVKIKWSQGKPNNDGTSPQ